MRKKIISILLVFITVSAQPRDIGTFHLYREGKNLDLYVEVDDSRNYDMLLNTMDSEYEVIISRLNPSFQNRIKVYVYTTQQSFWINYFDTPEMKIKTRGFGDANNSRVLLTSIYESCYPDDLRYKVPIHEMVHVIYPHRTIWIREGLANFEAKMLLEYDSLDLPRKSTDLRFYESDNETRRAYNYSGWLVQYIIEVVLGGEYTEFIRYARQPRNYEILGFIKEEDMFGQCNVYLRSRLE